MYNARISNKVVKILELLATERKLLGVSYIANMLSMNKSTVFGILNALQKEGYVTKEPVQKKYGAGDGLFRLSMLALGATDPGLLAKPLLHKLAAAADETAFLGLREGKFMKVITVVEPTKALRISTREGIKLPLVAGAFGKAFLSAMREREALELLEEVGLPQFTQKSIQREASFLDDIRQARKLGYAPDLDEYVSGVSALAAPVTLNGQPVGAVWVAGFTATIRNWNLFKIVRCLKDTARDISMLVGKSDSAAFPMSTSGIFDASSFHSKAVSS